RPGAPASRRRRTRQGHLVLRGDADESEGGGGLSGHAAAGGGDIGLAEEAEQADGGVAEGGHDLGRAALAHLGAIFVEGYVADPMRAVFDPPMVPTEAEQPGRVRRGRVGLAGGEAADAVDDLRADLA